MMRLPRRSCPSSHSRQSAVVGWVPVPKARPGSSLTSTASLAVTCCPSGQIHSRWPNCIGLKCSSQVRSQTWSSRRSMFKLRLTSAASAWLRAARSSSMFRSASNRAVTRVACQSCSSPGLGSSSGWLPASPSVTGERTEALENQLQQRCRDPRQSRWRVAAQGMESILNCEC